MLGLGSRVEGLGFRVVVARPRARGLGLEGHVRMGFRVTIRVGVEGLGFRV